MSGMNSSSVTPFLKPITPLHHGLDGNMQNFLNNPAQVGNNLANMQQHTTPLHNSSSKQPASNFTPLMGAQQAGTPQQY